MIVVDVETTGTDPARHAIISIGAIDLAQPTRQFYRECRIWEGAQVQQEALDINGFTHEQVTDPTRSSAEEVIGAFVAFCREVKDRTLGGHNTSFDRNFLQAAVDRHNLFWQFGRRVLDLHSFGWMHMAKTGHDIPSRGGRSDLSCDAILKYAGLPPEPQPHNGLMGAKMEAEAFSRLIYGKGLLEEFAAHEIPEHFRGIPARPDDQIALL